MSRKAARSLRSLIVNVILPQGEDTWQRLLRSGTMRSPDIAQSVHGLHGLLSNASDSTPVSCHAAVWNASQCDALYRYATREALVPGTVSLFRTTP